MAKAFLADQVKLLSAPLQPPSDASAAEKKAVGTLEAAPSAARKPLLQPEILSQVRYPSAATPAPGLSGSPALGSDRRTHASRRSSSNWISWRPRIAQSDSASTSASAATVVRSPSRSTPTKRECRER